MCGLLNTIPMTTIHLIAMQLLLLQREKQKTAEGNPFLLCIKVASVVLCLLINAVSQHLNFYANFVCLFVCFSEELLKFFIPNQIYLCSCVSL